MHQARGISFWVVLACIYRHTWTSGGRIFLHELRYVLSILGYPATRHTVRRSSWNSDLPSAIGCNEQSSFLLSGIAETSFAGGWVFPRGVYARPHRGLECRGCNSEIAGKLAGGWRCGFGGANSADPATRWDVEDLPKSPTHSRIKLPEWKMARLPFFITPLLVLLRPLVWAWRGVKLPLTETIKLLGQRSDSTVSLRTRWRRYCSSGITFNLSCVAEDWATKIETLVLPCPSHRSPFSIRALLVSIRNGER